MDRGWVRVLACLVLETQYISSNRSMTYSGTKSQLDLRILISASRWVPIPFVLFYSDICTTRSIPDRPKDPTYLSLVAIGWWLGGVVITTAVPSGWVLFKTRSHKTETGVINATSPSSYSQKPRFAPLVRKGGVPHHLGGKLSGMERGWDWMREWLLPGELLIIRVQVLLLQGLLRFFIYWMTSTPPLVTLADQRLCFLPS